MGGGGGRGGRGGRGRGEGERSIEQKVDLGKNNSFLTLSWERAWTSFWWNSLFIRISWSTETLRQGRRLDGMGVRKCQPHKQPRMATRARARLMSRETRPKVQHGAQKTTRMCRGVSVVPSRGSCCFTLHIRTYTAKQYQLKCGEAPARESRKSLPLPAALHS